MSRSPKKFAKAKTKQIREGTTIKETVVSREKVPLKNNITKRPGFRTVLIKTLKEVETIDHKNVVWNFSDTVSVMICNAIIEGMTIKEITSLPGSPPRHIIYKWLEKYEDFRDDYYAAKKHRADYFHDKIIEEAGKITEKNAKAKRVQLDALKWAAKAGNPEYGGNDEKGGSNTQVNIQVITGINRDSDEKK